jgi:adenine-specific DNA-methyltransferase
MLKPLSLASKSLRPDNHKLSSDPKSEARKPKEDRARLGQIFTPSPIAYTMADRLLRGRREIPLRILDPCVGPGTFVRAMEASGLLRRNDLIDAIDVDSRMIAQCALLTPPPGIKINFIAADYLALPSQGQYDLAILNPPYTRQEWITTKPEYRSWFQQALDLAIPGTANLYVYFLAKVLRDLRSGGRFAAIVYDSWQSTLFGRWLLGLMRETCTDLEFESVPNQPFDGRLIDATIIFGRKSLDGAEVSGRGVLPQTKTLKMPKGFRPLGELFETRRGLRLKQADFFLCDLSGVRKYGATPFVKKIALLNGTYVVPSDHPEAGLLVDQIKPNKVVMAELRRRLRRALADPDANLSVLTWYRERPSSWYAHRPPPYAPLLFNYYLRNRPRHIFNSSRGFADNFYGLRPFGTVPVMAWMAVLNSTAVCTSILDHARNQGAGLAKIQLFEYREVEVPDLSQCPRADTRRLAILGERLCTGRMPNAVAEIDDALFGILGNPMLRPSRIQSAYTELGLKTRRPRPSMEGFLCLG